MSSQSTDTWWRNAVIYQVYPRSFQDSDGDGIGDLRGIIQRLDYLQDLGVDALWLSPIFQSPMHDFGYDISDYRAIDPTFGTMADFQELLQKSETRGIKIILDGVFNHTSHQHPWFLESRSSTVNPKRDWYIWRKKRNRWLSIFGGSAWEKDLSTAEYYLHSFLKEQPDLNWRNPQVRAAVFDEIKFWLDMGVAGFRFDVINFFYKDAQFRNNPFTFGPTPRPYDLQKHIYDRNRPELHELLKDLRSLFDRYDAMMVGEIFSETQDAQLAASYLGQGDELHLAFDFSLMYTDWSARKFHRLLRTYHDNIDPAAWPSIVLSNHDQSRSLTRFGQQDAVARAKVLAALLLTMRGTPFIYYGEEIGMSDRNIPRHQIVDPVGKKYWPFHSGRDPARTPMQWSSEAFAGFSNAKPWLPVNRNHKVVNVSEQQDIAGSLLETYRILITLRKQHSQLHSGSIEFHRQDLLAKNVLAYMRDDFEVLLNFAGSNVRVSVPANGCSIYSGQRERGDFVNKDLVLQPYEAVVISYSGK